MECSNSNNGNNGLEGNLFDMLAEDDCLLPQTNFNESSSSGNMMQSNAECSKSVHENDAKDTADILQNTDQATQPPLEPSKPQKIGKCGKYNLRKSLAWDNAFFTSAGVLEPDELTCIIEGAEKDESSMLPPIEEDIHKSTDSLSTLGGESLECLEAGLFEDIRASIQRSSKASSTPNATGKTKSGITKAQSPQFSASKVDTGSRMKVKPKLLGTETSNTRVFGKSTKQSLCSSRDSCSSLPKVPKAADKGASASTTPSKRGLLGANRFKTEKCNVKSVAVRPSRIATGAATVSRIPPSGGPRSTVPRPISSRASSNSSTTKIERKSSSSSLDSLGSTFSGKTSNSPSVRRKNVSRVGNPPYSAAIAKNTSRAVLKDKPQSGKSQLSAYLKSVTKLSHSISPASSVSDWSSESSSSNITTYEGSYSSRSSLDCRRSSVDISKSQTLDSQNHSNDQCLAGHVTKGSGLLGQHVEKASAGVQPKSVSAKPTGLKMPSTKFGFFDGVKPARTPKGSMRTQSAVSGGFPKSADVAVNLVKGMIKEIPGKSQPLKSASKARLEPPSATIKPTIPVIGDLSSTEREVSENVKRCPSVCIKDNNSFQSSGDILFKSKEVEEHDVTDKHNPEFRLVENNVNLGAPSTETGVDTNSSLLIDGRHEVWVQNSALLNKGDADLVNTKQDSHDVPALVGNRDMEIQEERNNNSFQSSGDILFKSKEVEEHDVTDKHNPEFRSVENNVNLGAPSTETGVDTNSSLLIDGRHEVWVQNSALLNKGDADLVNTKQDSHDVPALVGNRDMEIQEERNDGSCFLSLTDNTAKDNLCNSDISCAESKKEPKVVLASLGNKDMDIQKEADGDSHSLPQITVTAVSLETLCADESKKEPKDVPAWLGNMDMSTSKEANGSSFHSYSDNVTLCAESKHEPKDVPPLLSNKDMEISGEKNGVSSFLSQGDNTTEANTSDSKIACPGKLFCEQQKELSCLPTTIFSEPTLETVGNRIPFAVKDSFYNVNELPGTAKKPTEIITEKLIISPSKDILKENGSDGATA